MRRERHNFLCWRLLHRQLSTQQTSGARNAQSRLATASSESQPSSEAGAQLTAFFSNLSKRFRCVTSPTSLVSIPIWDFYFDYSEWHIHSVRAWTPALMLHLTNPCTKRKVLILTKLKGKIYKTKSLCHYITLRSCFELAYTVLLLLKRFFNDCWIRNSYTKNIPVHFMLRLNDVVPDRKLILLWAKNFRTTSSSMNKNCKLLLNQDLFFVISVTLVVSQLFENIGSPNQDNNCSYQ